MKDATADIVADRVDGLKKQWLNNAIKDEIERLEGEMAVNLMRQAEENNERMRAEYQALVEKAQPEIDELFEPGVLERLRNAAAKVHHVERDERALEMAILIALGAQLAPCQTAARRGRRPCSPQRLVGVRTTSPTRRSSCFPKSSTRRSRSSPAKRSTTESRTTLTSSATRSSTQTRSRASKPSSSS